MFYHAEHLTLAAMLLWQYSVTDLDKKKNSRDVFQFETYKMQFQKTYRNHVQLCTKAETVLRMSTGDGQDDLLPPNFPLKLMKPRGV